MMKERLKGLFEEFKEGKSREVWRGRTYRFAKLKGGHGVIGWFQFGIGETVCLRVGRSEKEIVDGVHIFELNASNSIPFPGVCFNPIIGVLQHFVAPITVERLPDFKVRLKNLAVPSIIPVLDEMLDRALQLAQEPVMSGDGKIPVTKGGDFHGT